jgi:hypothetical protein
MAVVSAWRVWSNVEPGGVPSADQTAGYTRTPRLLPVETTAPFGIDTKRVPGINTLFNWNSYNATSAFDVSLTFPFGSESFTTAGDYTYPSGTYCAYVPVVAVTRATGASEPVSQYGTGWAYATEGGGYLIDFDESGGTADAVSLSAHRNVLVQMGRASQYVFSGYSNDPSTLVAVEIEAFVGFSGEIYAADILNIGEGYPPLSSLTVTVPTGDDNAEIQLDFDEWGNLANYTILSEGTGYPGISVIFSAPTPTTQGTDAAPSGVHHIPEIGTCWRVAAQVGGHTIEPLTTRPRVYTVLRADMSTYAREQFSNRHGVDISATYWGSNSPGFGPMADLEGPMGEAFVWASGVTATVQAQIIPSPFASPAAMNVNFYRVEMQQLAYDVSRKYTGGDGDEAAQIESFGSMFIPVATDLLGSATVPATAFTTTGTDELPAAVSVTLPTITAGTIVSACWAFPAAADAAGTQPFELCLISPPGPPPVGIHWTANAYAWPLPP